MRERLAELAHRSKLSMWMALALVAVCAAEMQPGLHAVIFLPALFGGELLLRWVARLEGHFSKHH